MKIKNITIENYRSIGKEIVLNTEAISGKQACILLGINESGKSNILEAIALLDEERSFNYANDCHSKFDNKDESIKISYELDIHTPFEFYKKQFAEKIPSDLANEVEVTKIEKKIIIDNKNERSDFYHIWIKDKKTVFKNFVLVTNTKTLSNGTTKKETSIAKKTEENTEIGEDGKILNLLEKESLEKYIEENFESLFNHNIPKVIFWKYEDEYLIQNKINLIDFAADTSKSMPLRNCFHIANIKQDEIATRIESIKDNITKKNKLVKELEDSVTSHINSIWPDHRIKVGIDIDNMQLSFLVKEKEDESESYLVKQRSDGFKHFVSILLNLSVENETGALKNNLIILDEPEIHLHPSGEKYLKEELLKISKNNLVIYATHSIFMIDKDHLNRHYSIEKIGVETNVTPINKDDPFKEQVLYESLGTSILEHIENKVIIFEGKTDRDIFDLYARKFKREIKLPNLSLISADGVENVQKYTKFFNNNLIKGFVILDADDDGMTQKHKVTSEEKYNTKNTFDINSLYNTNKKSTLEDLFDSSYIEEVFSETFANHKITLDKSQPYLEQIIDYCKKNQLYSNKKSFAEKEKEVKLCFFKKVNKLSKDDLSKQAYYKFFEVFSKKVV